MSRAVDEMRLLRAAYGSKSCRGDWSLAFEGGQRHVHVVLSGRAQLLAGDYRLALAPGDVVLLPRGLSHQLESQAGAAARESCELLSGALSYEAPDHPLFDVLPPAIHATPQLLRNNPRCAAYLEHLKAEALGPRDGSDALVARLTELLFIEIMRFFSPPPGVECPVGGWFAGLADPAIRRTLTVIHEDPARGWSVASLAKVAGESRSAFAAHFVSVMGEPPMAYLARWRMFRARSLLRQTELTLAAIAEQVGYGSAAAFSLAFTRAEGTSPGTFRAVFRQRSDAAS